MKPKAGLLTRAQIDGQLAHREIGVVLHGDLHAQVFRRPAGLAEDGHRLVGQGRHVVAFVAGEEIAGHAAEDRRAELLGDVQDDGSRSGRRRPPASQPASASSRRPFSAMGCQCKIEPMPNSTYSPFSSAVAADLARSSSRKDWNGSQLEEHAGKPQLGRQAEHADGVQAAVPRGIGIDAEFHSDSTSLNWCETDTLGFFPGDPAPVDGVFRPLGQRVIVLHDEFHDAAAGFFQGLRAGHLRIACLRRSRARPRRPDWASARGCTCRPG